MEEKNTQQSQENSPVEVISAPYAISTEDTVSTKKGGLVPADTVIPIYENTRFISSVEYFAKYSHCFPTYFRERNIAPACRKWHEKPDLPHDERVGLISEKRLTADVGGLNKDGTRKQYKTRKRWQWFVFDIPPQEHPGWAAYLSITSEALKRTGRHINKHFKKLAPIYLERFDTARLNVDHTNFRISELSKMIGVSVPVIRSWVEVGVEGFGRLPIIRATDTIKGTKLDDGSYITNTGRLDYYFATKDIRRFFKGEYADPTVKFDTIDDVVEKTNIDDIAAESGYYVYDPGRVYPATYEGFMEWAKKNIVFYDRTTGRKSPFKPNEKQKELYKNAFKRTTNGTFKHKIIGICRPRGEYKTFDVTILVLFRFFNMPKEQIYLVTNSVQQTSHLIYREATQIIRNSPTLSAMLDTPALDIQKDGIYLRSGKGVENIFSFIEIVSAEGGARSNATCIAWSEAWKYSGNPVNVAELEQSIRGVDNAWFLVESTVAPKGHFFHTYYVDSLTGENPVLYFQYYDETQRQNPKIDADYINHVKRNWPLHYKMFFGNRWEDAVVSLFSPARIIEMGCLGIDGGIGRNAQLLECIDEIVALDTEIKKYEGGIDVTRLIQRREALKKRLTPVGKIYTLPATSLTLRELSEIYNCDFIIGIGIDRAKQLHDKSDRTVVATVARGVLDAEKWGTDRIFFLLDLVVFTEMTSDGIIEIIQTNVDRYGGGFAYIDIEDYNAIDIYKTCEKLYGKEAAVIAPNSIKHQTMIFDELRLASENGYLKIPPMDIWFDDDDVVHYTPVPPNKQNILLTEMSVFEAHAGTGRPGKGRDGWFGSAFKRATGRAGVGKPKDDCVYALAYACHAAIRGDIPASTYATLEVDIYRNMDLVGKW